MIIDAEFAAPKGMTYLWNFFRATQARWKAFAELPMADLAAKK